MHRGGRIGHAATVKTRRNGVNSSSMTLAPEGEALPATLRLQKSPAAPFQR